MFCFNVSRAKKVVCYHRKAELLKCRDFMGFTGWTPHPRLCLLVPDLHTLWPDLEYPLSYSSQMHPHQICTPSKFQDPPLFVPLSQKNTHIPASSHCSTSTNTQVYTRFILFLFPQLVFQITFHVNQLVSVSQPAWPSCVTGTSLHTKRSYKLSTPHGVQHHHNVQLQVRVRARHHWALRADKTQQCNCARYHRITASCDAVGNRTWCMFGQFQEINSLITWHNWSVIAVSKAVCNQLEAQTAPSICGTMCVHGQKDSFVDLLVQEWPS